MKKAWSILTAREKLHLLIAALLAALFFFGLGHNGYVLEADSYNYINCNFGREPLYPIFLLVFRTIFGEPGYLTVVWIVQSLLAVYATVSVAYWLQKQFRLKDWTIYGLLFLLLIPYWFVTLWFSPVSLWTNHIITEGLTFSLYYLSLKYILKTLYDKKMTDFWMACLWSVVLALLRSQMLVCLVLCLAAAAWMVFTTRRNGGMKRVVTGCLIGLLAAAVCYSGVKALYRYQITDSTEEAGTMQLALLANLLYSSDREDVSVFTEPEFRTIYLDMYDRLEERQLNERFAGGLLENGERMYEAHDLIKYGVINEVYYDYVRREGNYTDRTSEWTLAEVIIGLEKPLLQKNVWRLLKNSMCSWPYGFMRTVFTASKRLFPFNLIFCLLLYLSAVERVIYGLIKKHYREVFPMLLVLLFNLMTVAGVSLTIFVSMRYLMYNLGFFYIAYGMLWLPFEKVERLLVKKDDT